MKQELKRRLNIVMLMALLAVSMLALYVPHHHHEGRFCMEQTEESSPETTSGDDCQFQTTAMEYKGDSKSAGGQASELNENPEQLILAPTAAIAVSDVGEPESTGWKIPEYSIKSHKLRGSPYFS